MTQLKWIEEQARFSFDITAAATRLMPYRSCISKIASESFVSCTNDVHVRTTEHAARIWCLTTRHALLATRSCPGTR